MFWIVSGKPGSSKTSHTIDFVLHDKRFLKDNGEPRDIYYRGIRELQLPWHELDDEEVARWPEILPPGAVLIVDEAQQIWPPRPHSRPVPPGLTALETHRHQGWDIIFISQDPSLLDVHARKICNEQFHFSRPFGAPFAVKYHSGSGYVDPSSKSALNDCEKSKVRLPKRVWGLYKSSEVHTHKFKPPKVLFVIPILLVVLVVSIMMFKKNFFTEPEVTETNNTEVSSNVSIRAPLLSSMGWSDRLTPEIRSLPYTAPIFEPRAQAVDIPVVAGCMSMLADFSDCECRTQQNTLITQMSNAECVLALQNGVFDPFHEEREPVHGWDIETASNDYSRVDGSF